MVLGNHSWAFQWRMHQIMTLSRVEVTSKRRTSERRRFDTEIEMTLLVLTGSNRKSGKEELEMDNEQLIQM